MRRNGRCRSPRPWAKRLKHVFGIEVERCNQCGGEVKIIAAIESAAVIHKILDHLGLRSERPGSGGNLFEQQEFTEDRQES